MNRFEFAALCRQRADAGEAALVTTARLFLHHESPEIAAALAEGGGEGFLEPHLQLYFAHPRARHTLSELAQVVFGSVLPELRPDTIEIRTDRSGRAFLPRIGHFLTDRRAAALTLSWDRCDGRYALRDGEHDVSFVLEGNWVVPGTRIEVARHGDPRLASSCLDPNDDQIEVLVDGVDEARVRQIGRALEHLAWLRPDYHAEILRRTRRIVCFRHPSLRSFAPLAAHGTVFLNLRAAPDEVSLMSELARQCGRVVFAAMSVSRLDYLAIDPDTPLFHLRPGPEPARGRTINEAFRDLFTAHVVSEILREADQCRRFVGREAQEVTARLARVEGKRHRDWSWLADPRVFTAFGRAIHRFLGEAARELHESPPGPPKFLSEPTHPSRRPERSAHSLHPGLDEQSPKRSLERKKPAGCATAPPRARPNGSRRVEAETADSR